MIEIIPIRDKAFWRARVNLDGSDFLVDFAWNGRHGAWALSLLTADGTPLVQGITLVTNRPLLRRFKSKSGMPAGEIMATDPTGTVPVAGYRDLGPIVTAEGDDAAAAGSRGGVHLYYFEALEGET